jgi:sugar-phosphatase
MRPTETFQLVCPDEDPERCLRVLATLEDHDARTGRYGEFPGAADLLRSLPTGSWGLVTSNYEHRVRIRFQRLGLPLPAVIVDAAAVGRGKPDPAPYLLAARRLGADPVGCLAVEDSRSGVHSAAAAGMRVISVNTPDPVPGSHHHFDTLRAASREIRAFIS